ncbi:type IV secretion system protein VirB3 [Neoehrlichia mikurensis]|uniref:Type IV secretion system protein VirB3 n=1 Tax=Neoehrlichia mikurensis TaxID=89586 RepID=A0A9Q9BT73_9RICK|nr:type IV secretion system protein VirB3 [Neoehrlichia mikurensis]QXK91859.1 type IV secretion system protein VirB3 [Neoehrlichia mikurensis]QXK93072.1 type IV secretion system protein VirB3 [Neoehrlichia mikurensis]QXK93552.1 type IV secretion system protein VirB3 [Neoehrlichia mikurensis]UTO55492.1 type IV secretion system protein VirB3 [Neoehrlichia mikurensis]UTO56414.1 type IV secretion system protein VirB3 [Neoehrlichia mikurensis]
MSGGVKADQLFKGLTRPTMLFGVSYTFAILNFMICIMIFMYSNDFRVLLILGPGIHGIGYLASAKDPLFLDLFIIKMQKCSKCLNRFYHNANSYDVM